MSAIQLLNKLKELNVAVQYVDENLKISAPKGALNKHLVAELKKNKLELITLLKQENGKEEYQSITPVEQKEFYPLSSAQKRLYILQQMDPESTACNIPRSIKLSNDIDVRQLEDTFKALIKRHESFRTSFQVVDEQPVQRIHDDVEFEIEYYDDEADTVGTANAIERFVRPFDLATAPLLRVGLVKREGGEHLLLMDMNHIISDGVSHQVLKMEFLNTEFNKELPELKLQYKDFAQWQNNPQQQERVKSQEKYWLERLSDELPVLDLPIDYPRPAVRSFNGNTVNFTLDPEETKCIKQITRDTGTTLYMVILSIYNILLSKISGQQDIIVGIPIAGRRHPDLERIIGMFVNILALRNFIPGNISYNQFLTDVKKRTLEAYENQEYQFENLVEKLSVQRDTSRNPILDVVFNMFGQDGDHSSPIDATDETHETVDDNAYKHKSIKFDLILDARDEGDRISCSFMYGTSLFKESTIRRMIDYVKSIIAHIAENTLVKIADIEIIPKHIKEKKLKRFNANLENSFASELMQIKLVESFSKYTHNVAVEYGGKQISYAELERRAAGISQWVLDNNIRKGRSIAICCENKVDLISAIIGILDTGCVFVPLDSKLPTKRLQKMLQTANVQVLLTDPENKKRMEEILQNNIAIEKVALIKNIKELQEGPALSQLREKTRQIPHSGSDHIYTYFTSGSSGRPNAVAGKNQSLAQFIQWEIDTFSVDHNTRISQLAGPGFDAFLRNVFTPILAGGTVCIPSDRDMVADSQRLVEWIDINRITLIHCVPTIFRLIQSEPLTNKQFRHLKFVIMSGEHILANDLKQWYQTFDRRIQLVNCYGATETTIIKTCHYISPEDIQKQRISAGLPIKGTRVVILDQYGNVCDRGITGEIYIRTPFGSHGYLDNSILNAQRFIPNPFQENETDIIYRTGDLGRELENGEIEILGRMDKQIKIRGIRIELDEIKNRLLQHIDMEDAAVVAKKEDDSNLYLSAYFTAKQKLSGALLREYLSQELPDYMIPSYFIQLDAIPLTVNGKVDENALPQFATQKVIDLLMPFLKDAYFDGEIKLESTHIDLLPLEKKKQLFLDILPEQPTQAQDTRDTATENSLVKQFEKQVQETPENIAVVFADKKISYRELDQRAGYMARYYISRGIKPGTVAAVLMEPSPDMIAAIIGILKAGGTYVALSADMPQTQVESILNQCHVSHVLTDTQLAEKYSFVNLQGLLDSDKRATPLYTGARQVIKDLDSLPIPNRSLVDYEKYHRFIGQSPFKNSMSLVTGRGCPFSCAYCHKVWPKTHGSRSGENMFEEVKLYYDMGVRRFAMLDDIFNLNREASTKLFKMIIKNKMDLSLSFNLRSDLLTNDYVDLMVEAGATRAAMALETASPRLQKLIKKNLNIEKLRGHLEYICDKYPQLILELYTMHGFPTETKEEAMMTLDFIKSIKWLHFPYVNILRIYQSTPMEKVALEYGISKESILASSDLAFHELPETLPFDKTFTKNYQASFLNQYFLNKERLIHVLPHQMKALTEDEILQKYRSYIATDLRSINDLLTIAGISPEELGTTQCLADEKVYVPNINEKLKTHFTVTPPIVSSEPQTPEKPLKILLLDLSQYFSKDKSKMLYDVVEAPMGLLYVATYLDRELGRKVDCKVVKSRIDFNGYDELKTLLDDYQPDIVGIRTLTFYRNFLHRSAAVIKQHCPDIPIIVGGPYSTSDYLTILSDLNIDAAVVGEGENTFRELVEKTLENGGILPGKEDLREIKGLAFMSEDVSNEQWARQVLLLDTMTGVTVEPGLFGSQPLPALPVENESTPNISLIPGSLENDQYQVFPLGRRHIDHLMKRIGNNPREKDNGTLVASCLFEPSVHQVFTPLLRGASTYIVPHRFKIKGLELLELYTSPSSTSDAAIQNVSLRMLTSSAEVQVADSDAPMLPGDIIEETVLSVCMEVLGIQRDAIRMDSDLFELGLHSLKATILANKIHKALNVKIPLPEIFNNPTAGQLAEYIKGLEEQNYSPIKSAEEKKYYPLSSAQKRLFILQQMQLENINYNSPHSLLLNQSVELGKLEETFNKIIARHESLRTSFHLVNEYPVQKIHEAKEIQFSIKKSKTSDNVKNLIGNFVRPFDLSKAPLLRVELVESDELGQVLLFDMHHIITDGTSRDILQHEFISLYSGKELPPLTIQYKDFSEWQNSETQQQLITPQEKYWVKQFSDELPVLDLPIDYARPEVQNFEGNTIGFELNKTETEIIKRIAVETDSTLFMVILSMYNVLLSKLTGQEDIIIGTVVAGRRHEDLQQIIGMFANTLALRYFPSGDKTAVDFLHEVKEKTLEAFENQDYQFEELVDKMSLSRHTNRNPLVDVGITLFSRDEGNGKPVESKEKETYKYIDQRGISKIDLTLIVLDLAGRLFFNFEYCKKLFKPTTIERFIRYIRAIISQLGTNISQKISDITIMADDEQERLLYEFNRTQTDYPKNMTIPGLFEEQVKKTPDKIAVMFDDQQLTYNALNEKVNPLARHLRSRGVKQDTMVGIMVDRSLEIIIGILGILKAGGGYVPVDPDSPTKRLDSLLDDCNAPILLTNTGSLTGHSFTALQSPKAIQISPCRTATRPQILDFDSIPIPNRSLIDFEKYNQYIGEAMVKNSVSIQATRGCPYLCAYCHKIWPKKHVYRSAEHIFDEVMVYYNMGVRRFAFIDDIFNLNLKNSMKFFQMVIDNGLDIQIFFPNGVRADILTEEYIDLMVKAGTVNVAFALETASPRLQKLIGKNLNLDKFRKNLEYICTRYPHVMIEMFTMHGFPTETKEEATMTLNFIKSIKWIDFPYVLILKVYPNTDMEKLALENGVSKDAIRRSENFAYHELPDTLPFEKSFTRKYQSDFFDNYFLRKERLLEILPYQLKIFTIDEILKKYNSFMPYKSKDFSDLLRHFGIEEYEPQLLSGGTLTEESTYVPDLNRKLRDYFPAHQPGEDALKILILDLSQEFRDDDLYFDNMAEPPLGPMYLLTYLNRKLGAKVNGKIAKSGIDFLNFTQFIEMLNTFEPDIIGFRSLTFTKDFAHKTVSLIKQWRSDVPVIAGGPYATSGYSLLLKDKNIDLVVVGEGEITFHQLVEKIILNDKKLPAEDILKKIPGIAFMPESEKQTDQLCRDIIMMDELPGLLGSESHENPTAINEPGDLAYALFTSGSTGLPKAVAVEHKNVVRLVKKTNVVSLNEEGNMLQTAPLEFDASTIEIWGSLLNGLRLSVTRKTDILNPRRLKKLIRGQNITIMWMTSPLFNQMLEIDQAIFSGLENIMIGGEALSPTHINLLKQRYPELNVINGYGPTENTTFSTTHLIDRHYESSIPIGKPIANSTAYILDKNQKTVPIGTKGELWVGGDGVARGYLNNPELTRQKFIANPFVKGDILYRTGDIARWLPDFTIDFLGRVDSQVKIRGIRIELNEIESHLLHHEEIKEAVVLVKEEQNKDKSLCAYIVLRKTQDAQSKDQEALEDGENHAIDIPVLKERLSKSLPNYLIPTYFVQLERLPLNPNGKIDKKSLPEPEVVAGEYCILPRNEFENKLAEIWSNVLGIEKQIIGIKSNFFELGGNSLKAAILVSKLHKELNVEISLVDIFAAPTIEELSEYIKHSKEQKYISIKPVDEKPYYQVSSAQKRLFLVQQLQPESTNYNTPITFPLDKNLDIDSIERTFRELIKRHEIFRTSFELIDETPVQVIHDYDTIDFAIEHYRSAPGDEIENAFVRPFDLSRAPLLRAGVIKTPENNILLIDMHHIVSDGLSLDVLKNEFLALHEGKELQPLKLQYKDYSEWQNSPAQRENIKKLQEYWLSKFSDGVPLLNLPTDYSRPVVKSIAGDHLWFEIDTNQSQALKEIALAEDVTLFMLLLAIFNVSLAKVTSQDDIVVGTAVSGRVHPDLEPLVGMFVNMLSLRTYPIGDKHFNHFLKEVREITLGAFENQDYPFEDLVDQLLETRDPSRSPLFDVVFSMQNVDGAPAAHQNTAKKPKEFSYKRQISRFDLTMVALDNKDKLKFRIEFSSYLFARETIERFVGYFEEIIASIVENKKVKLKDIEVSHDMEDSEAEMVQIDFDFGDLNLENRN
jgi:amino acid adenylation domain-containing protein